MKPRTICIVTGTRAEYGLLYWLMRAIQNDPALHLQLIVTGAHLSPFHGNTCQLIEQDGFVPNAKVEMLLASDTPEGIAKSIGLGIIGLSDAFQRLQPDIVVILGDRYEMLAAAQAAFFKRILIAHISGGEKTIGALDDTIRHCISKLANIHFPAMEAYKKRLIQLGEHPDSIFVVGDPAADVIRQSPRFAPSEVREYLGLDAKKKFILITFHPETASSLPPAEQIQILLDALQEVDKNENVQLIFTASNADEGGQTINDKIKSFVHKNPIKRKFYNSLGQKMYISAMACADLVLGNSSSALTEAPLLGVPSVDIGNRQTGRPRADSVIHCDLEKTSIVTAIMNIFRNPPSSCKGKIYYTGESVSQKIKDILKNIDIKSYEQKIFYDLQQ